MNLEGGKLATGVRPHHMGYSTGTSLAAENITNDEKGYPAHDSILFFFLAFPPVLYMLSMVLYWFHIPITLFHIPLAVMVCALAYFYAADRRLSRLLVFSMMALPVYLLLLALIQSYFFDFSWDGRQYHGDAVNHLAAGWNPVYERLLPDRMEYGDSSIWLNTMPKFPWVLAACVYKITGLIATSKIATSYYFFVVFFVSFRALHNSLGRMAWLVAAGIVANPVATTQLFTNYIDATGYFLLIIFILSGVTLIRHKNTRLAAIIFPSYFIAIAATKLTILIPGLVGAVFFLFFSGIRAAYCKKRVLIGLFFISVLSLYTPHISNLLIYGTPLYPTGDGKRIGISEDFPAAIVPPELNSQQFTIDHNIPAFHTSFSGLKFFESLFSRSANDLQQTHMKVPFAVRKSEWKVFHNADVRTAGFGPLFSAALCWSVIVLLFSFGVLTKKNGFWAGIGALGLTVAMLTPGSWWARYVPYVWLAPILFVFPSLAGGASRKQVIFSSLVLVILLINGAGIARENFKRQYADSRYHHAYYASFVQQENPLELDCSMIVDEVVLREHDIAFYCSKMSFSRLTALAGGIESFYSRHPNKGFPALQSYGIFISDRRVFGDFVILKDTLTNDDKLQLAKCFASVFMYPRERLSPYQLTRHFLKVIWSRS